jgi:hypothetical protein
MVLTYVIVSVYFAAGVAWAIWVRPSFDRDDEWLAAASFVVLLWGPMAIALVGVRVYHELVTWHRRRTR